MAKELEKKFCPKCLKQYDFKRIRCSTCRVRLERPVSEPRIRHLIEYEEKIYEPDRLM